MAELTSEKCGFPGCERPIAPAPEGAGRPSRYCELPEHNAQSAFRERRRRADAGEGDVEDERAGGERPVSLAGATLRHVAARLAGDLERTRDALAVLTDSEQLEAELAAVRADTHAEISSAAQQEAAARRERMQADEAAEAALKAAEEAELRTQAATEAQRDAEARAGDAEARAEQAERTAQDAVARAEAATAAQAAAQASAVEADQRAKQAVARAENAERERDAAIGHAGEAQRERDLAREQARHSESERQAAEQDAQRARKDADRAEQQAQAAERRAEQADARAQKAVDRADRAEERARSERAALDGELAEQREARQAGELARAARKRRWRLSSGCAPNSRRISRARSAGLRLPRRPATPRSPASRPPPPPAARRRREASAPKTADTPSPLLAQEFEALLPSAGAGPLKPPARRLHLGRAGYAPLRRAQRHFCGLQAVRLQLAASAEIQVSSGGSPNASR